MATSPGWLKKFIPQYGSAIERAIGMKLGGNVLGCGHWGCVVELSDPRWVLKVSRDPTEGPLVQRIMQLRKPSLFGYDGIVYYHSLMSGPSVRWRGKDQGTFLIVREAIRPRMLGDDTGLRQYRSPPWLRPGQNMSLPPAWTMDAVSIAKEAAAKYFSARGEHQKDDALSNYIEWCSRIGDSPNAEFLGYTMTELVDENIVLRDVHLNNIGWSVVDWGDEGPRGVGKLVIHDLGHTPTEPTEAIQPLPLGAFLAGLEDA